MKVVFFILENARHPWFWLQLLNLYESEAGRITTKTLLERYITKIFPTSFKGLPRYWRFAALSVTQFSHMHRVMHVWFFKWLLHGISNARYFVRYISWGLLCAVLLKIESVTAGGVEQCSSRLGYATYILATLWCMAETKDRVMQLPSTSRCVPTITGGPFTATSFSNHALLFLFHISFFFLFFFCFSRLTRSFSVTPREGLNCRDKWSSSRRLLIVFDSWTEHCGSRKH